MTANIGPNVTVLRMLYQTDAAVEAIMDYAAARTNNSRETSVDRILVILSRQGNEISRGDTVAAFRKLSEAGLGDFIVGRRGASSRFRWSVSMRDAGMAARGESDVVSVADGEDDYDGNERPSSVSAGNPSIRHSFNLRPNYPVNLDLPGDLTEREAVRLADFIKTLPFDQP